MQINRKLDYILQPFKEISAAVARFAGRTYAFLTNLFGTTKKVDQVAQENRLATQNESQKSASAITLPSSVKTFKIDPKIDNDFKASTAKAIQRYPLPRLEKKFKDAGGVPLSRVDAFYSLSQKDDDTFLITQTTTYKKTQIEVPKDRIIKMNAWAEKKELESFSSKELPSLPEDLPIPSASRMMKDFAKYTAEFLKNNRAKFSIWEKLELGDVEFRKMPGYYTLAQKDADTFIITRHPTHTSPNDTNEVFTAEITSQKLAQLNWLAKET